MQLLQCKPSGNARVEPVWAFQWYSMATAGDNFHVAARQSRVNDLGGVTHQGALPAADHDECSAGKL